MVNMDTVDMDMVDMDIVVIGMMDINMVDINTVDMDLVDMDMVDMEIMNINKVDINTQSHCCASYFVFFMNKYVNISLHWLHLHCGFSSVSSNFLSQRMHSHIGCICLIFLHCVFSNDSSYCQP